MKISLIYFALLFLLTPSSAQVQKHAHWKTAFSPTEVKTGETIELIFTAQIDDDWYLYSTDFDPKLDAPHHEFIFEPHPSYTLVGKVRAIGDKEKFDDIWQGNIQIFTKKAEFRQKIKILTTDPKIIVRSEGQTCSNVTQNCVRDNDEFTINNIKVISSAAATPAIAAPDTIKKNDIDSVNQAYTVKVPSHSGKSFRALPKKLKQRNLGGEKASLLTFIMIALGAGLISLFTPCVFPMIPMTVTFFTNSSITRAQAVKKALLYGFSIIFIYTLIGLLLARFNGPEFANFLSTHWVPNVIFFLIFFVFALSFLGMFEITLPASFVNRVDSQADKGGLYGVFFMALTLVLVSFSCTGPIVGALLVEAAGGSFLKPILGMLAYSLAFGIPFTLFALFPSWLNRLPRSGGWLNIIKVILGFIELALAFKFLSVADQVYHWNLLDREVYLAIWIIIFIVMGVYLLGKIRLPHDSETSITSVPRLILAILSFSFSLYLIPGMFGAPLKALSGYLPPMSTHDFDIPGLIREATVSHERHGTVLCEEPKYYNRFNLPHGLKGYFQYEQALRCAREKKIPLFIDFTGHGCTNCREMEANVWSDPEVFKILNNDFLVVALYVDDKMDLPENEMYISPYDNKKKKTIGAKNTDLQITRFNNNAQPFYVLLDPFTEEKLAQPIGYESSVLNFIDFLEEGKANFKELHPQTNEISR